MVYLLDYFQHRRDCQFKQAERIQRIQNLTSYHGAFTNSERQVLSKPIEELVTDVHKQSIQPIDILHAYGKAALKAHEKTNSVTEVMIDAAEGWIADGSINMKGPLAGIPVSLKDSIVVGGFDTTVGYSSNVGNKVEKDGIMVRILKDAGAIPYVKTNLPITLLSFESTNDVWGRCTNPHNNKYSPGGSTGGESALLAAGGGRIGIGSDVAGSVRVPAHFSGIYSLKCSTGRWPKNGMCTSMPGQEDFSEKKKLRVGVLRTDGVVDPSPACIRAVDEVVAALEEDGHEVYDVNPPSPTGEWVDSGAKAMSWLMSLPRPFKWVYWAWVKYVKGDDIWAGLIKSWHEKSAFEHWKLVAKREAYKAKFHAWWEEEVKLDFMITPPNATPAVPHDGMKDAVSSCGYTFLFNLLDYTAGVMPITHVDKELDQLPSNFSLKSLNRVAYGAYKHYDATAMHGLPVGNSSSRTTIGRGEGSCYHAKN
ncbi:hypothetical protein DID88_000237 [Monilinia fructigena]|uniref:Amidase domain-containing protein n=1 Tax=Monilinia fructigena TaxID=38457 RepID=A0A395IJB5_9HELO|nr:hypothetical protein DID88_000237 [Monilinia fructigena]